MPDTNTRVKVVDVDIPLGTLATFMIKWAVASIPAIILLGSLAGGMSLTFFVLLMLLGLG